MIPDRSRRRAGAEPLRADQTCRFSFRVYPRRVATYELMLPDYFDTDETLIEAKGWVGDAVVTVDDGRTFALSFYDPARLSQDARHSSLSRTWSFSSTANRQRIEQAVAQLSETDLAGLVAK